MPNKIKTLKINPQTQSVELDEDFDSSITSMQNFVGGFVGSMYLEQDKGGGVILLFDQEGDFKDYRQFRYVGLDKEFIIRGNALICRFNKEGDFTSLTGRDVALYSRRFRFLY